MKKISTALITLIILLSHTNAQDFSSFSPGPYKLTPFSDDGLWGYKNHLGEIVIKPKFEFATPFYDRNIDKLFTVAKYKNKWVIINERGKIENKLDADEVSLKRNDYAWIYRKDNKYGVIYRNGEILTEPIYDFIQPAPERIEAYRTSHFIYKINGKIGVGFIDDDDKSVFEFIKPDYYQFYNDDMTPININFHENSCFAWGDDAQKIKLDYSILRFIENKTIIYKKFNTYFINYKESKVFTPVKYELDSISPPIKIIPLINKNVDNIYFHKGIPMLPSKNWYYVSDDNEFCRIIKKNGKWGVIFKHNEDEIDQSRNIKYENIIYDSISSFSYYGITTAYINDKCGLINQNSKIVLDFNFDKIIPLSTNYFALQKDNLWGISYLDSIIFLPKYNDYKLIENNWHLKKEDNWGVFSHDGKMLCDFKYNEIQDFENFNGEVKFAKVIDNNKVGLINQNFEEVLAPKYGEVLKIQLDNNTKDLFVFVKEGGLYGSVNLNKSKIDNIYNKSSNYNSIEELENQIIIHKEQIKEEKRIAEERRLAEEKQAEARRLEEEKQAEARRVEEEKRQRKIQMAEEQVRQKELKKMYAQLQSTTINYISRFLKSPDGASWISYNGPEETRRQLNESRNYLPNCDNVFATMITVDATNSFGGYIRSTYIVFFKDNYPCHFEDIKAIDKARNSASRIGDMNNMLSLTLQLNGCGCK
jgi:hypothetical protein